MESRLHTLYHIIMLYVWIFYFVFLAVFIFLSMLATSYLKEFVNKSKVVHQVVVCYRNAAIAIVVVTLVCLTAETFI